MRFVLLFVLGCLAMCVLYIRKFLYYLRYASPEERFSLVSCGYAWKSTHFNDELCPDVRCPIHGFNIYIRSYERIIPIATKREYARKETAYTCHWCGKALERFICEIILK